MIYKTALNQVHVIQNRPLACKSDSECENCMIESDTLAQYEKCKLWLCCDCQCISPNMLKTLTHFIGFVNFIKGKNSSPS